MQLPSLNLRNLSRRQQRIVKISGFTLLGIVTFLVSLQFAFPYERTKGKLIELLSDKYDVTVGHVGHGLFPGEVVFENVVLRTRPTKPNEKAREIVVDRLEVDLGIDFNLIGALRKKVAVGIDVEMGGGEIEGEFEASKSLVAIHFETDALPLGNLPGVADAVGLPLTGDLDADIDIRLPGGKWKDAEGRISIGCDGCIVGDGVSKMTMSSPKRSTTRRRSATGWGDDARSITVPRLSLGETSALVEISKGVGDIKNFSAESKDGWLKIAGKIEFRDPFATSLFPGCMQFRLSDELKKREPNFGNIEFGISEKLRQTDGSYAIPTRGRLTELRWDPRRKCGGGAAEEEGAGDTGDGEGPSLGKGPSLSVEQPTPGGTPVAPGSVPAVSGGATLAPPAPGTSGPPMDGTAGEPPTPPGAQDAGPATGGTPAPGSENKESEDARDREHRDRGNAGEEPAPAGQGENDAERPADDRDAEDRREDPPAGGSVD